MWVSRVWLRTYLYCTMWKAGYLRRDSREWIHWLENGCRPYCSPTRYVGLVHMWREQKRLQLLVTHEIFDGCAQYTCIKHWLRIVRNWQWSAGFSLPTHRGRGFCFFNFGRDVASKNLVLWTPVCLFEDSKAVWPCRFEVVSSASSATVGRVRTKVDFQVDWVTSAVMKSCCDQRR